MKKTIAFLAALLTLLQLVACKTAIIDPVPTAPDYSQDKYWSIRNTPTHDIDVFFVHPTTYGPPSNGRFIADLADKKLNEVTDRDTVDWITAVFKDSCNIFAPRYRQVNIEVMKMDDERKDRLLEVGVDDVEAAFKYYLNNLNNGRPFILASHSQGSNVLQVMLIKNPDLLDKDKLVAAYMPGWTFTDQDLAAMGLPLGESPDQTGCLMAWNTIGPGGISPTVKPGARCVNPLSWTSDSREYPASMDIEARIFLAPGKHMLVKHFTSARINKDGALEIPSPGPEVAGHLNMSLGREVYHRYDYDFFFNNIKENVNRRCAAYLAQHPGQQE